jgi:tRNA threonylcarbamoyladenosine biosynthesis protein TsaB
MRNGDVLGFEEYEEANTHAERLLPLVESVLRSAQCTLEQVNRIAVGNGPGNFTGLRVGIALAYGLGIGLGIPVVGVGSLATVASTATHGNFEVILVLRDARKSEFFGAAFDGELNPLLEPHLVTRENVRDWVKTVVALHSKVAGDWTLVGDGLTEFAPLELANAGARLLPCAELMRPNAKLVGSLGALAEVVQWPLPEYIRDVDAVLPSLRKNPVLESELP